MMQCVGSTQRVAITNTNHMPLVMSFANRDVYDIAAAKLDEHTGVLIPTTSVQCVDRGVGDMVLQYTQGNGCVHRRFAAQVWGSAMQGRDRGFAYTVPPWSSGHLSDVCEGITNNNTSGDAVNQNSTQQQAEEKEGMDMLCMAVTLLFALAVLLALVYMLYTYMGRRRMAKP